MSDESDTHDDQVRQADGDNPASREDNPSRKRKGRKFSFVKPPESDKTATEAGADGMTEALQAKILDELSITAAEADTEPEDAEDAGESPADEGADDISEEEAADIPLEKSVINVADNSEKSGESSLEDAAEKAGDAFAEKSNKDPDDDPEADADDDADDEPGADGISPLPLASIVEALLFAAREPLKPAQIARAVGKRTRQDAVRDAVAELNVHYLESGRAFEIAEISGCFQLMSRPEYAKHIMRIYPKREQGDREKKERLTPAALDTLAIVAYRQPVMRSEIEHIRGVACGPMLKTLIERGTVREVGRREDLVGKPAVFGTTDRFLVEFGLASLDELPFRNDFANLPGLDPEGEAQASRNIVLHLAPVEAMESPEKGTESEADGNMESAPADETDDIGGAGENSDVPLHRADAASGDAENSETAGGSEDSAGEASPDEDGAR